MNLEPCTSPSDILLVEIAAPFGVRFYGGIAEAVCLGSLTFLTVFGAFVLCKKGFRDKANVGLLAVAVTMYINSLVHFSVTIHQTFSIHGVQVGTVTHQKWFFSPSVLSYGPELAAFIEGSVLIVNVVLSDAIVMWRAWAIWEKSTGVLVPSIVLSFATLGIRNIELFGRTASSSGDIFASLKSRDGFFASVLALCVLSLLSNLWALALVGWKAWLHRRWFKQLRDANTTDRSAVWCALALLLESGAVYSMIWALFIAAIVLVGTNSVMTYVAVVLTETIVYIAAMYPSAILLIAALQKRACNEISSYESPSRSGITRDTWLVRSLAELLEGSPQDYCVLGLQGEATPEKVIDIGHTLVSDPLG
ncbi:hypothetical protein BC834DRAFT_974286 [Gloeopeniophorella convolvens]|nr:hypothetical protein BC834DRAFT_974286 [Gloeopeniophorella convolvens]